MPSSSSLSDSRAAQLIAHLQLKPHPEGGWYREVFRSASQVAPADGRPPRAALTSIYFLLEGHQHSCWHQVLSDEVWVYLEGAPLALWLWDAPAGQAHCVQIGPIGAQVDAAMALRTEPQHVVTAGLWQAALPLGGDATDSFTLVACMVGPGFDFSDFRMMQPDSSEARSLRDMQPGLAHLVPAAHTPKDA
ncbi:MAG: cupin domain-containing protein [Polaromonas sp.]